MKVTIHRALAELKLVDAKIEKGIRDIYPLGINKKGGKVDGWFNEDDFRKDAVSSFDSTSALIQRKISIKSAIVKSNGATMVTVGGKEMTVSDAISFKTIVKQKTLFIESLKLKYQAVTGSLNKNNETVNKNLETLLAHVVGKDNVKATKEDIDAISKPYLDNNLFYLVDPIGLAKKIEELEKEVGDFNTEIDAVLSESNAITFIEI